MTGVSSVATAQANKALVRRVWDEVWNGRNLAVADEIFAPEYAAHERAFMPGWLAAFPDWRFEVEDMVAEADRVVTRFVGRGTHRGRTSAFGLGAVAATGRPVEMRGYITHRLADGRIVEGRGSALLDRLGVLEQLGATVTPPPASGAGEAR
jgi:predicted ester cyclase